MLTDHRQTSADAPIGERLAAASERVSAHPGGLGAAPGPAASGPSRAGARLPMHDNDQIADYLRDGYWSWSGEAPRSFDLPGRSGDAGGGVLRYNVAALSPEGAALADAAFALYAEALGIDFQRTTARGAGVDILFSERAPGAFTETYADAGGGIGLATVNISRAWLAHHGTEPGSYGFQTYLHEIGHALGLGHAGPYDARSTYVTHSGDPAFGDNSNIYRNDSWQASLMSYFSQSENTAVDADLAHLLGPMAADWIALDAIYGLDRSAFAGDTTWGFNTTITGTVFADLARHAGKAAFTIIDGGGRDRLDFSGFAAAQTIDLNPERVSSVGGLSGNMVIARGTRIEDAIGGAGDDTLIGNAAKNALYGRGGDDLLDGGAGRDRMHGGPGNDVYRVNTPHDRAIEREAGAAGGFDTVQATSDFRLGPNVEALILTGAGARSATGNGLANTIEGNAAANKLRGLGGADELAGGLGADVLIGGPGRDVFRFDALADSTPGARDILRAGDGAVAFQKPGPGLGDRIDLSSIDADATRPGAQPFVFGAATGKGRLWATDEGAQTVIRGNVNDDRRPEFELAIADGAVPASAYAASDFIL